ncbi:mammalian cell entry protein, partial [Nocardia sp. NPDC060220]
MKLTNRLRIARTMMIATTALALGSCSLMPSQFDDALGRSTKITADFENIAGMYEGNEIMVLGLAVG